MSYLLIAVGTVLIIYTVFVKMNSNWNLGVVMPAVMGLPLIITGLFFDSLLNNYRFVLYLELFAYVSFFVLFAVSLIHIKRTPKAENDAEIIIACGAAVRNGKMCNALLFRMQKALEYVRKSDAICVVCGGKGKDEEYAEAYLMSEYLIKNGIDRERIIVEDKSESTRQNFLFAKEKLNEIPDKIAVVTSDFHIYRALREAKTIFNNSDVYAIPAKTEWYMKPSYYLRETAAITKTLILEKFFK